MTEEITREESLRRMELVAEYCYRKYGDDWLNWPEPTAYDCSAMIVIGSEGYIPTMVDLERRGLPTNDDEVEAVR